jgi:hypothetical protein
MVGMTVSFIGIDRSGRAPDDRRLTIAGNVLRRRSMRARLCGTAFRRHNGRSAGRELPKTDVAEFHYNDVFEKFGKNDLFNFLIEEFL